LARFSEFWVQGLLVAASTMLVALSLSWNDGRSTSRLGELGAVATDTELLVVTGMTPVP
jgi:hypothetical protein